MCVAHSVYLNTKRIQKEQFFDLIFRFCLVFIYFFITTFKKSAFAFLGLRFVNI